MEATEDAAAAAAAAVVSSGLFASLGDHDILDIITSAIIVPGNVTDGDLRCMVALCATCKRMHKLASSPAIWANIEATHVLIEDMGVRSLSDSPQIFRQWIRHCMYRADYNLHNAITFLDERDTPGVKHTVSYLSPRDWPEVCAFEPGSAMQSGVEEARALVATVIRTLPQCDDDINCCITVRDIVNITRVAKLSIVCPELGALVKSRTHRVVQIMRDSSVSAGVFTGNESIKNAIEALVTPPYNSTCALVLYDLLCWFKHTGLHTKVGINAVRIWDELFDFATCEARMDVGTFAADLFGRLSGPLEKNKVKPTPFDTVFTPAQLRKLFIVALQKSDASAELVLTSHSPCDIKAMILGDEHNRSYGTASSGTDAIEVVAAITRAIREYKLSCPSAFRVLAKLLRHARKTLGDTAFISEIDKLNVVGLVTDALTAHPRPLTAAVGTFCKMWDFVAPLHPRLADLAKAVYAGHIRAATNSPLGALELQTITECMDFIWEGKNDLVAMGLGVELLTASDPKSNRWAEASAIYSTPRLYDTLETITKLISHIAPRYILACMPRVPRPYNLSHLCVIRQINADLSGALGDFDSLREPMIADCVAHEDIDSLIKIVTNPRKIDVKLLMELYKALAGTVKEHCKVHRAAGIAMAGAGDRGLEHITGNECVMCRLCRCLSTYGVGTIKSASIKK